MRRARTLDAMTHKRALLDQPTGKPDGPVHPEAVFLPTGAALALARLEGPLFLQGTLGLQAFPPGVRAQGRHGLFGHAVLQQAVHPHAGLLQQATALGLHAIQRPATHRQAAWRRRAGGGP